MLHYYYKTFPYLALKEAIVRRLSVAYQCLYWPDTFRATLLKEWNTSPLLMGKELDEQVK